MNRLIFKNVIAAITLSSLSITFTSNATPVITEWDFIVDSAYTASSFTDGSGTPNLTGTNALFGAPTNLAWGDQAQQSSIDISSGNLGNVTGVNLALGTSMETALFVHDNISIPLGSSGLETAILSTLLQITPASAGFSMPDLSGILAFDISFNETSNIAGLCGGVLCANDIFILSLPEAVSFNDGEGTINQQFSIFEHTYNTELKLVSTETGTGLSILNDIICARVPGIESGCIGLTTFEEQSNEFRVLMTITHIPEPSTLLLLSLVLFGTAVSVRSKRS